MDCVNLADIAGISILKPYHPCMSAAENVIFKSVAMAYLMIVLV